MELEYGYTIDRKTVGRIITALKEELDLDIESKKGGGVYLAERDFEDYEIQFLIDIVSSNPFISAADSKELRSKLSDLAGAGYRIRQRKNVIVLDAAEKIMGICTSWWEPFSRWWAGLVGYNQIPYTKWWVSLVVQHGGLIWWDSIQHE